jgi:hypothetical protein
MAMRFVVDKTPTFNTDPNTKLLLHFDQYPIIDFSSTQNTINNTDVERSSAQSKFGGYSGLFNGTSAFLSVPHSSDFNFGSSNFTVDFWLYSLGQVSSTSLVQSSYNGLPGELKFGWMIYYTGGNTLRFYWTVDGGNWSLIQGGVSFSGWEHIAVVRNGNNIRIYLNGEVLANGGITGSIYDPDQPLLIGRRDTATFPGDFFNGYLDELRISNVARWTDEFTPPTSAY